MDCYNPRLYLPTAFVAGILLTLGFKDFYPDLERRFRNRRRRAASTIADAGFEDGNKSNNDRIALEDHTTTGCPPDHGAAGQGCSSLANDVPDGIESCVGNTPLFRIKSLSEETGCEIFAKAEVISSSGTGLSLVRLFIYIYIYIYF